MNRCLTRAWTTTVHPPRTAAEPRVTLGVGLEKDYMINSHLYLPQYIGLIQSGLDPDEQALAACDFVVAGTEITRTSVVTNRHVRFMGFKTNWLGQVQPNLAFNSAVAVRTISGISTGEGKTGLFGPKVLELIFFWEGHQEHLITAAVSEGKAFVDKLKLVVAGRDTPPARTGVADELQKLAMLTREGILSEDDWAKAKDHLIGVPASQIDEATQLLRQLHALRAQGVLNEAEFNMKKWDILSERLMSRDRPRGHSPTQQNLQPQVAPVLVPLPEPVLPEPALECPLCNGALDIESLVIGNNTCPHCGGTFEAE